MVNTREATKLAESIEKANEGHSLRWLSEQSGVAYSTLKRNLEKTPEKFNVEQLIAIATALDLEPGAFLALPVGVAA